MVDSQLFLTSMGALEGKLAHCSPAYQIWLVPLVRPRPHSQNMVVWNGSLDNSWCIHTHHFLSTRQHFQSVVTYYFQDTVASRCFWKFPFQMTLIAVPQVEIPVHHHHREKRNYQYLNLHATKYPPLEENSLIFVPDAPDTPTKRRCKQTPTIFHPSYGVFRIPTRIPIRSHDESFQDTRATSTHHKRQQ